MLCTLAPLTCCGCSVLLLRYQAVWSPPLFTACVCVCDLCRVRVLVRLSYPRPPDRNQHGCTVGVLPGPTRVLPMPRQYGIVRRANSCCAELCCVVVSGGASSTSSCGLSRPYVLLCVLSQNHFSKCLLFKNFFKKVFLFYFSLFLSFLFDVHASFVLL